MDIDWSSDYLSLILLSLISSISIYFLLSFSSKNKFPKKKPLYPPGLHPYPIIGHLPQFLRNRHRFLEWSTNFLSISPTNTLIFRCPGRIRGVVTANPANVEHMLNSHFHNYPKGDPIRSTLQDFLGHGIFNADGSLWRLQRKRASAQFNTRSFLSFAHRTIASEISSRLIPFLRHAAQSGESIDLQNALESFAFNNICKIAFDVDAELASDFASAFREASNISAARFRYAVPGFWRVKKVFDFGSERNLREKIAIVHDFAKHIIHYRKTNIKLPGRRGDDLLSRFIADEENNSDKFLCDIIISFILAGHETTSSALSWFFWLLSSNPRIENRILDEVKSAGSRLGLDELRRMHYLHASVTETMRLYPPVPFNSAVCSSDDVLPDGTEMRKGYFMVYHAYAMGRMKDIWGENCEEFWPERWLEIVGGEFRPESPFRFPVFHGGPRMCLGKEMAYIQMKSIAAAVIERFELKVLLDEDTCPEPIMSLTLRMRDGLPVCVRERCSVI